MLFYYDFIKRVSMKVKQTSHTNDLNEGIKPILNRLFMVNH